MTADLVSDFDYHPYEPHVRQFRVPRGNVLRFDAEAYVCDALFDDMVLRHYAFCDEWFKVNVTKATLMSVIDQLLSSWCAWSHRGCHTRRYF